MSHIIGKRRYAGETYPIAGSSPLAAIPFAQFSLSENVPYTPGDPAFAVHFDTIVYETAEFGEFGTVPTFGEFFLLPFGAYMGILQIGVVGSDVEIGASLSIASGSATDVGADGSSGSATTISMTAMRLANETPSTGTTLPCVVLPVFTPPSSGSPGEIDSQVTKLFIWQLQRF